MKNRIILGLAVVLFPIISSITYGADAGAGGVARINMDEQFYFYNSEKTQSVSGDGGHFEIQATNDGSVVSGVTMRLFGVSSTQDEAAGHLIFDTDNELGIFDIFPAEFIILPEQKKLISVYPISGVSVTEEHLYRIRAIPEDATELLRKNPALNKVLSTQEKYAVDEKERKEGSVDAHVSFAIGSGSIIVSQPFSKINDKSIDINLTTCDSSVNNLKNTICLKIKNSSVYTYKLDEIKIHGESYRNWSSLIPVVVRGGKTKVIELSDIKFEPFSISYKNQIKDVYKRTLVK